MSRVPVSGKLFGGVARVLHWLMAVMVLCMLFIGVGMVATVSALHDQLVNIHKPLGIAVLVLAALRLLWRLFHRPPALPADLSPMQAMGAKVSHWLLYGLMFAIPLVGWAMLSAAGLSVTLGGGIVLPPLVPMNGAWYACLRPLHGVLAYGLFVLVLVHLGAALHHGLVRRDGVLRSMLGWERGR